MIAESKLAGKPAKPSPDFPLFAHNSGQWAKKIRGKVYYFGKWDSPDQALEKYQERFGSQPAKILIADRTILTVKDALNLFLNAKLAAVDSGAIEARTYDEYFATCSRFADFVGKACDTLSLTASDFAGYKAEREKTCNVVVVGNEVSRVRTVFNWLKKNKHITELPNFGTEFRKPSQKLVRRHKREQGKRMFQPEQIRLLLTEAGTHLRAMILLGINCGFGPADCAMLPISAIDLDKAWLEFPRPKTEIDREAALWPETVEALRTSLKYRHTPKLESSRLFVRHNGRDWNKDDAELSKYFTAVRRRVLPDGGMYWLRRTFETVAGNSKDQVAVDYVMGHVDDSMAAVYRQGIDPQRLRDVVDYVRTWLFG